MEICSYRIFPKCYNCPADYFVPCPSLTAQTKAGLPLASIQRRSQEQLLEGPWAVLRGQVYYETAAVQKYSALHMMPFVLSTTQFWVQFCQTMSLLGVHFQVCWLIIAVIYLLKGLFL